MIRKFIIASSPLDQGIILTRVATGLILSSYGLEAFDAGSMQGYFEWLKDIHFPAPVFMAYVGKCTEFVGGIFLAAGFLTRFASVFLMTTMAVITFIMGDGNVRSDSFFLLLLSLTFFFLGSGKWSLDYWLFVKKN